jgi:hypothetical protein
MGMMKVGESFPCLVCGKVWTGHKRCHCSTCHENFGSLTAFTKHRINFECQPPQNRGLVYSDDGYWVFPGSKPTHLALGVARGGAKHGR